MALVDRPLLVDTNAIIEAHRIGCWNALAARYRVETVERCVIETQTGAGNRRPESRIAEAALRAQLSHVNVVTAQEIAFVALLEGPVLDAGERELWAHALHRKDAWILCGPDIASMKFGFQQGFRERLICIQQLLDEIGVRNAALRHEHTRAWLDRLMTDLALGNLR